VRLSALAGRATWIGVVSKLLIDPATRSAQSERVAVEPPGPVPLKGKAAAVAVFSIEPGKSR